MENNKDVQEQGPKKGIVLIVIAILLGTNGLLLWQFFDKKSRLDTANETIITTTQEKDNLQKELDKVMVDYQAIKTENANLNNQIASKDEEISAKVAEIKKLIALGGPAEIAKAKSELAKLKEMNAVYMAQIDSLKTENQKLVVEKQALDKNLTDEQKKSSDLSQRNEYLSGKISAASILRAERIVTEATRAKSKGEQVVTKARQAQNIRTKFTLLKNVAIEPGTVDIYLRAIGPDGSVSTGTSNGETINVNGQELKYTMKQSVEYNNEDTDLNLVWAKAGSNFQKGKYTVEIYQGTTLIGTNSMDLK